MLVYLFWLFVLAIALIAWLGWTAVRPKLFARRVRRVERELRGIAKSSSRSFFRMLREAASRAGWRGSSVRFRMDVLLGAIGRMGKSSGWWA